MVSTDIALQIEGLNARYGARAVLEDVSLSVRSGEVLGLFGHNGAGKTTLLRVIAGIKAPTSGTVLVNGRSLAGRSVVSRARGGMALVPEGVAGLFPDLTVAQNLDAVRHAGVNEDIERVLRDSFREVLVDKADQVAGTMSGGQRQMLALTIALVRAPSLLLLDEPSTGLSPIMVDRIFGVVGDVAADAGMTVVVVEQDVRSALKIADRGVILRSGTIVADWPKTEIPAAAELWAYF